MALWKVSLVGGRAAADCDEYDACVVRAPTETEARAMGRDLAYIGRRWRAILNPDKWTCERIEDNGPTEIIVESFNAG